MSEGWVASARWDEVNPRGVDANVRSALQMREYAAIADRIAADRPDRVLDWGCGFGQMSYLLGRRGVEVEPYDVDPDAPGEEVRPLKRYPGLTARVTPEEVRVPYPDASFDAVLSCGVLEHVVDPHASLDELARVLRPGGTLYVFKLPNRFSYLKRIAKRLDLYYHGRLEHDRLYTLRTARELVESRGYAVLEDPAGEPPAAVALGRPRRARLAAPLAAQRRARAGAGTRPRGHERRARRPPAGLARGGRRRPVAP